MKQISIIIPTLNEAENILKIYQYFESNNIQPYEVIIADHKSSSDYSKLDVVLQKWKYLKCKKIGRACQMNEGAKIAKGNIFMFLHADVLPPVTYKADILNIISNGSPFGIFAYNFFPESLLLSFNASFTKRKGLFVGGGDQIQFLKRALFQELGGYDEKYTIMEDFELMRRVKKNKIAYSIIQNPAIVSSRKYIHNSWFRVNLANLTAFILFLIRAHPNKIKRMYYGILK